MTLIQQKEIKRMPQHRNYSPYSELLPDFLDAIFDSLKFLVSTDADKKSLLKESRCASKNEYINLLFINALKSCDWFGSGGVNRHLVGHKASKIEPIYAGVNSKKSTLQPNELLSRLASVLINIYDESQSSSRSTAILPSPLFIAYRLLTVPNLPESHGYALVTLKNYLFSGLNVLPDNLFIEENSGVLPIKLSDVKNVLDTINTYDSGRDNFSLPLGDRSKIFVYQFLLLTGFINLRFKGSTLEEGRKAKIKYCENKDPLDILSAEKADNKSSELRINSTVVSFPDASKISNLIWGNPIPVRGLDTIFLGGLKTNSENNLVVGIHGEPGAGKTSFCLGIAASLAPLGVKTLFISNEEEEASIHHRLEALISEDVRRLDFHQSRNGDDDWFTYASLRENELGTLKSFLEGLISIAKEEKCNEKINITRPKPPNIVVLDGIHQFFTDTNKSEEYLLSKFVQDCRNLNLIVFLTVSSTWSDAIKLDHLIDVSLELKYKNTNKIGVKPQRLLSLHKSRQQVARGGTHVFHLSGNYGLKVVPQIPSQMDLKSHYAFKMPEKGFINNALNFVGSDEVKDNKLIDQKKYADPIYKGSHILIYGEGSGGKAGLSLLMALTPLLKKVDKSGGDFELVKAASSVLVVSFLYPKEFYEGLGRKITNNLKKDYKSYLPKNDSGKAILNTEVDVICLYPGYLSPEDLYSKVISKLDQAELEGRPYDSVVIDGLHNITIQFPKISGYDHFWPLLYSALRRRYLTVISTHTIFNIDTIPSSISIDDNRIKPLLHAMVQSADVKVVVNKPVLDSIEKYASLPKKYMTDVLENNEEIEKSLDKGYLTLQVNEALYRPYNVSGHKYWDPVKCRVVSESIYKELNSLKQDSSQGRLVE